MADKMKVWPGANIMVPMPTDVFLVGQKDIPKENGNGNEGGSPLANTKLDYYNLFKRFSDLTVAQQPFIESSSQNHLKTGAHIMWTLPHTFRKGEQPQGSTNTDVKFNPVPNRWMITRYEYNSLTDGSAPIIEKALVVSNQKSALSALPPPANESQYPESFAGNSPCQLGKSYNYEQWTDWNGDELEPDEQIELTAMGPGAPYWSVTYDNVRNIFTFHDDSLSETATKTNPVYYTYMIIGWYDNPEKDILYNIATTDNKDWQKAMNEQFKWTVGHGNYKLNTAITAWQHWQKRNGISGTSFHPDENLPPQAKTVMQDWYNWWKANGESGQQPDLARQCMCHSMVSNIKWEGAVGPYLTATTEKSGTLKYPQIATGNNAVEAISIFMADKIVNESGIPQPEGDVNQIARALEAFQKSLLYEYQSDPIRVENQIHNTRFTNSAGGYEWIVVRAESNDESPSKYAGQKNVGLNKTLTNDLSALNALQEIVNELNNLISTQRNELFALYYKHTYIKNRRSVDGSIVNLVNQSITALTTDLKRNIKYVDSFLSESSSNPNPLPQALKGNLKQVFILAFEAAGTQDYNIPRMAAALSNAVKNTQEVGFGVPETNEGPSHFIVKKVDKEAFAAPTDPVVLVSGGQLDTKLSSLVTSMGFGLLDVRYTGQFISAITITYKGTSQTVTDKEILNKIAFFDNDWRVVPKETISLLVETVLLDKSAAALLAVLFFEMSNILPDVYNAKTIPSGAIKISPLEDLTKKIEENQLSIWAPYLSENNQIAIPTESLLEAAGYKAVDGLPQTAPALAGIAFRNGQPWTPIFLDWNITWIPDSKNATDPFSNWELGEIDYNWTNKEVPDLYAYPELQGRSVLNPGVAQNIQLQLADFKNSSSYKDLPEWLKNDLEYAAGQISTWDILTQSISGFTEMINTKLLKGTLSPTDAKLKDIEALLANSNENFVPQIGSASCTVGDAPTQTYSPIRSGHIKINNIWVVDAFGQIMYGKSASQSKPLDVTFSENMTTPIESLKKTYGQLSPRLAQAAKAEITLLQSNNDLIYTNSSDATNPICGWVMSNHLDNSLMVFDQEGVLQGSVIKVSVEKLESDTVEGINVTVNTSKSIRWDPAPGLNATLGAPPNLPNVHLERFINGLLDTRFKGSRAFDDFLASIDSTLWTMSGFPAQNGNLSLLVGRPIAVVRAQVELNISGNPTYQQQWCATGYYYNNEGTYDPKNPPYINKSFSLRIGDAYLAENGVMGYFEADDYSTFYSVYGINGQTKTIIEIIRAGEKFNFSPPAPQQQDGYLKMPHTVKVKSDGTPVYLTVLADPTGNIPIFPGSLPYSFSTLPSGPVEAALKNLKASFRMGPLLLEPGKVKMPTPAEVRGEWSWINRENVNEWTPDQPIDKYDPLAKITKNQLTLLEGWLNLADFQSKKN